MSGADASTGRHVVLVVDDHAADLDLAREALADVRPDVEVVGAEGGDEALAFLGGPAGPRVRLVLLDLNLPRRHGFDVLRDLRGLPGLAEVPVVLLTSVGTDEDVRRGRELGASDHRPKPMGFREYLDLLGELAEKWLAPRPG